MFFVHIVTMMVRHGGLRVLCIYPCGFIFLEAGTLSGAPAMLESILPQPSDSSPSVVDLAGPKKVEKEKQKKPGFVPGGGLPAIPSTLVERRWKGDWVNFQNLLPENIMEQFKNEKDKRRKPISLEKFSDWVLSFALFAEVMAEKELGRGLELF